MLKRKISIVVFALLMLCFLLPSFAYAMPYETEWPDDLDQEYISNTIVDFINQCYPNELSREVTKDDIDFSKGYKFYVGTNIFELETNDLEEVKTEMEKGTIVYELPVNIDADTVVANIQRVPPATKTGLAMMEDPEGYAAKVGTWDVSAIFGYFPPETQFSDYYTVARDVSGIEDRVPLLVGGLPCFTRAVALYADDNGNLDKLVTISPGMVDWESLGMERQGGNRVLDYAEVKSIVQSLPPTLQDDDLSGGYGAGARHDPERQSSVPAVMLAILAAAVIAAAVYLAYRKKHGKHRV